MRFATTRGFPEWLGRVVAAGALIVGLGTGRSLAAAPDELGHPVLRDFPPGKSNLAHLCQAVIQGTDDFIYIANGTWLRYYDGRTWLSLKSPPIGAGVRKFALTAGGTIYLGGAGIIGWIRATGVDREFVSLAGQLPAEDRAFEDIYDVLAVGETVYFSTEQKILIWRPGQFTSVACPTPPRSHGARLHRVGDTVYVTAPGLALSRLTNGRLEPVADDAVLRQNQIIAVEAGPQDTLRLLTAERGFFQIVDGRVTPFPTEADRWVAGKRILCMLRLADGSMVVAFSSVSGDGGMRFGADGRLAGPLDQFIGLYVNTIRAFHTDREGGLWLATETGLIRVEWPSAVTVFDAINGLGVGAMVAVTRHENILYAATTEGVYRLVPGTPAGQVARIDRVFNQPVYALLAHPAGLLARGYADLLVQDETGFTVVAGLPPGGGGLAPSRREPERVWIATMRGIQSVRHSPKGWTDEGLLPGFDENVVSVTEAADGSLWVSTAGHGRFHGLIDPGTGRPGRFARVEEAASPPDILAECPSGRPGARWIARATEIELVPADGGPARRLPQLAGQTAGPVTLLHEENDAAGAVLWIGGGKGLVRVELARAFPAPLPLAVQLNPRDVQDGEELAPGPRTLHFDYLALRHQLEDSVNYQSRLTGFETAWTSWSTDRQRVFANLPAGDYRFEVRARDADGQTGAPASLGFAVLPVWWLTWWALGCYAVAGAGCLSGVVRFRTRALRRRAAQLEAVVASRTAELAQRNTELVRLNQLELDEKISARLAEEKARLEVLRYQLNPHFLFNTLASISAVLPRNDSTARTMVERLAEFCRLTLHRADERDWTTLGDELRLLRAYLEIEQSRWGDLLDVEIACDPALTEERLPHFLLLPLVENALKYGRATSSERVGIRLAMSRGPDGAMVLAVANTGEWIEPEAKKTVSSLGIGLENLRERLARHYARRHHLDIAHRDGWVTVTLRLLPQPGR